MSSLTGIAQFTNRFAQNIMGYEQDKKDEAERVADKQYNRNRQQQTDLREQQNHDVTLEGNQITLNQNKIKNQEFNDSVTYEQTRNQLSYLDGIGADEQQKIDVLAKAVNSNQKLPYKIEFERDVTTGKIIQRQGPDGKPFYFQTIIDKETGQELGRKGTTFEEATGNYNQLQNAGAIEDEIKAAAAARAAKTQEIDDKLTLKRGEAIIDDAKDANKQQREHIYKVDEMGVKHGYTVDELGVKHGFTIDELGVRHANAVDIANVNSQNRIGEYVGRSDVDAGGTPIVNGGGGQGAVSVVAAGPGWTKMEMPDGTVVTAKGNRNFRNNNIGNIEYGPFAKANGAIGSDGRFAVFPDNATGAKAMESLIFGSNSYRNLPLSKAIGRYAPKFENDTAGYASKVLAAVGGKDKPMSQYTASERQAIMRTMVSIEGKNNATYSSGGNTVARSVPAIPKLPKGESKTGQSAPQNVRTVRDYTANVDKGFEKALKLGKSYGIKADAASTSQLSQASNVVKGFAKAKSYDELASAYADAVNKAVRAIPERERKKLSNAQKKDMGAKMVLTMAGASSHAELLEMVYAVNRSAIPIEGSVGAVKAGGLTLPGQQPSSTPTKKQSPQVSKPASQFQAVKNRKQQEAEDMFNGKSATIPTGATPQTGKLQGLYARGLPAPKTDPKATENLDYLENLNDNMDW